MESIAPPFDRTHGARELEGSSDGYELKADAILLEEFSYAGVTAYQAFEDRARIFNLYLLLVGVLASGLGVAYQLGGGARSYLQPLALILVLVTGLLGTLFFLSLINLRKAHQESLRCMNQIKDYYVKHLSATVPDIREAFRWTTLTIPKGERFGSVTFVVCHTVALIGSLCYGGTAFVAWVLFSGSKQLDIAAVPLSLSVYYLAAFVFGIAFLAHILYFRRQFTKGRRRAARSADKNEILQRGAITVQSSIGSDG